eukprot:g848.t1
MGGSQSVPASDGSVPNPSLDRRNSSREGGRMSSRSSSKRNRSTTKGDYTNPLGQVQQRRSSSTRSKRERTAESIAADLAKRQALLEQKKMLRDKVHSHYDSKNGFEQPRFDDEDEELEEMFKARRSLEPTKETFMQKFKRKFRQEPFVPIGAAATLGILTTGLWSFSQGPRNANLSQKLMRARVLMQGATICAIMAGTAFYENFANDEED